MLAKCTSQKGKFTPYINTKTSDRIDSDLNKVGYRIKAEERNETKAKWLGGGVGTATGGVLAIFLLRGLIR